MKRSRIYNGFVEHARLYPVGHRFKNKVTFFAFDLEDVENGFPNIKGFAWNRFAPVSGKNADYLTPGSDPLRKKLEPWIAQLDLTSRVSRISLVTAARWWGKAFNPVSFYLLEDGQRRLIGIVAEVNNTFGDRHVYAEPLEEKEGMLQAEHVKEFHVSPFNSMEGRYQFSVRRDGDDLYIGVDLYREGTKILEAWIEGTGEELTTRSVWSTYIRHPLRPWLTMPRIVWQAIWLKFRRKLPVFTRPEPSHSHTIRSRHKPV